MAEDEMVGWHQGINGHESEQTLGESEGQGSLACCGPWGHEESDMTWQLNNSNKKNGKDSEEEYVYVLTILTVKCVCSHITLLYT